MGTTILNRFTIQNQWSTILSLSTMSQPLYTIRNQLFTLPCLSTRLCHTNQPN